MVQQVSGVVVEVPAANMNIIPEKISVNFVVGQAMVRIVAIVHTANTNTVRGPNAGIVVGQAMVRVVAIVHRDHTNIRRLLRCYNFSG